MAKGQRSQFAHEYLEQAKALQDEKEALYKRIDANRTILRSIRTGGELSPEQAQAIEDFYPTKKVTKKS